MKNWSKNLVAIAINTALLPFTTSVYAANAEEVDNKKVDEVITILV